MASLPAAFFSDLQVELLTNRFLNLSQPIVNNLMTTSLVRNQPFVYLNPGIGRSYFRPYRNARSLIAFCVQVRSAKSIVRQT